MRDRFLRQLALLHDELIQMGSLCEEAIASAAKGLIEGDAYLRRRAIEIESQLNDMEREVEDLSIRLLRREQPVAGDLRTITAAVKMITDMERIGDQAADISEIAEFLASSPVKSDVHIAEMARATIKMVTDSVHSFVANDLAQARAVIAYDDVVDELFRKVKIELIEVITKDNSLGSDCLDLLMIAKYFERIGDHATNIAEWVVYSITGDRD